MNDFYVYLHRDTYGNIFYIGKGRGERAYKKSGRNKAWLSRASLGYSVDIYRSDLTEHCALCIERILIGSFGIENLTNILLGGFGNSGYVMPEENKRKISEARKGIPLHPNARTKEAIEKRVKKMKGRKHTKSHNEKVSMALKGVSKGGSEFEFHHKEYGKVKCTPSILMSTYNLDRNILGVVRGRVRSSKGWSLYDKRNDIGYRRGKSHHKSDGKRYMFFNCSIGSYFGTRYEFSEKFNLHLKMVGKLVRGKTPSYKGWRINNVYAATISAKRM